MKVLLLLFADCFFFVAGFLVGITFILFFLSLLLIFLFFCLFSPKLHSLPSSIVTYFLGRYAVSGRLLYIALFYVFFHHLQNDLLGHNVPF
jgi:hypothetical protein